MRDMKFSISWSSDVEKLNLMRSFERASEIVDMAAVSNDEERIAPVSRTELNVHGPYLALLATQ